MNNHNTRNSMRKNAQDILGRQYTNRFSEEIDRILLRKEVIQPHLPVRLPCYDLALLTGLTLGVFFPCGLDKRLRVLPTQVA